MKSGMVIEKRISPQQEVRVGGNISKPGSRRFYGKTKRGKYMSEKAAIQKGYRPANVTDTILNQQRW